jgi:streptogramin lyase
MPTTTAHRPPRPVRDAVTAPAWTGQARRNAGCRSATSFSQGGASTRLISSGGDSGLAWAEGTLWVGQNGDRKIHQIDPGTGAVPRTLRCDRFVTGVAWTDGELWHGAMDSNAWALARIDPRTGEVLESIATPPGTEVSGLEADGGDRFFCGGGSDRMLRAVRRHRRGKQ